MNNLEKFEGLTFNTIYYLTYHIILQTVKNKPILEGTVRDTLISCLESFSWTDGSQIFRFQVLPDHVHIFVIARTSRSVDKIVSDIKRVTNREIAIQQYHGVLHIVWEPEYYYFSDVSTKSSFETNKFHDYSKYKMYDTPG